MSGVAKAVTKVFKKVVDIAKPVLPIVAVAAGIYLTAGLATAAAPAAAAAAPAAAAAGGAAAPVAGAGISGTLGSIASMAAKQSLIGAAVGGIGGAVTGQDPIRAALAGAAVGAVSGGIQGYMAAPTAAAPGASPITQTELPNVAAGPPDLSPAQVQSNTQLYGGAGGDRLMGGNQQIMGLGGGGTDTMGLGGGSGGPSITAEMTNVPAVQPPQTPGFFGQNGWLERNPIIAGTLIQGLGSGIMAATKPDDADQTIKIERERQRRIDASYRGVSPGNYYSPITRATEGPTPMQRFAPADFDFEYDPSVGRIVRKPTGG